MHALEVRILGGQCWMDTFGCTILSRECWVGNVGLALLGGQCWVVDVQELFTIRHCYMWTILHMDNVLHVSGQHQEMN